MSYGTAGATCADTGPQLKAVDKVYLECLPILAERAEMLADRLDRFVDRFNGPTATGESKEPQPPACHRTLLDRISNGLHRAEEAAAAIERIG